jgi:hypothetical protein
LRELSKVVPSKEGYFETVVLKKGHGMAGA